MKANRKIKTTAAVKPSAVKLSNPVVEQGTLSDRRRIDKEFRQIGEALDQMALSPRDDLEYGDELKHKAGRLVGEASEMGFLDAVAGLRERTVGRSDLCKLRAAWQLLQTAAGRELCREETPTPSGVTPIVMVSGKEHHKGPFVPLLPHNYGHIAVLCRNLAEIVFPDVVPDRITVDTERDTLTVDKTIYPLTPEHARIFDLLVKEKGGWVPAKRLKKSPGVEFRMDRMRMCLPTDLRHIIESRPGYGSRICSDYFRMT